MYQIWIVIVLGSKIIYDSSPLPVTQSQKCSARELKNYIQCFKEIPLTDYYVLINDSIAISCVVNNQHGKVQWRAKNLVLGYDRSVPGMPRLQIIGDVTKGEHNLKITKAQTEDSGDYECQVQPVDAHPLLRRKSTLHVTKLPSIPYILYKNEIPKNNEIIIDFNVSVKKMLKLICVSEGGLPQPIFQWFWNSREVTTDEMEFILIINIQPNKSSLSLPLSLLKSGHQILCVIKNKATELLESRLQSTYQRFEAKVTVIMFVRSGNPLIQNSNQIVDENNDMEFTCSMKPTGHPKSKLKWSMNITAGFRMENLIKIKYNENQDELITNLLLKKLNRTFHRVNVSCISESPFITKSSPPFQIYVKHNPQKLSIVTFNEESDNPNEKSSFPPFIQQNHLDIISGIENEDINVLCFTSSYYGTLNMKWILQHGDFVDGSKLTIQILSPLLKLDHYLSKNHTIQTFITQKIKLKRTLNSGFIECHATTENQILLKQKTKFNVFYQAKISVISGYVSQFPVHEGDIIHLTCCSYGGNPSPTLRWYKNNSLVLFSDEIKTDKEEQTLDFLYRVFKHDNGQKVFCEAKSENVKVIPVKSNFLIINVIFPPVHLEISCLNCIPNKIMANRTNEFLCESSSSNPGSIITWKLLNCSSIEIGNSTNCSSTVMQGTLSTNFPGQYNGWKTQSKLNLLLNYKQNNFILQCQSRLSHKILPEKYKPIVKNIKLKVLYPPFIMNSLNSLYVFEGSTVNLQYQISANPKATHFSWYFQNRFISSKQNLIIKNIHFNDSGSYKFVVENLLGSATRSFEIDVKYSPKVVKTSINIFNDSAEFFCEASMNPIYSNFSVVWRRIEPNDRIAYRDSRDFLPILSINYSCNSNSKPTNQMRINSNCGINKNNKIYSKLIISPYQESDFGWYQCMFCNGIGMKGRENLHLNIPIKPWYLKISQYSKQGTDISHHSLLTCCFLSHVNPSIFWLVPFSNEIIFSTNTTEIRQSTFCGFLHMYVKEESYFGQYKCQAKNERGSSRLAYVSLLPTFQPDFPESFKLFILFKNNIHLSWIKGADGGSEQTFQLRWWDEKQQSTFRYQTVKGNQSKETLEITISNFSIGSYSIDIGVNSIRYPDFRYCCAISFVVLSDKNDTFDGTNTKSQTHVEYPDVNLENLNLSIYYIIIASSIVVFLSLFFALFIFVCIMKHRRKSSVSLQNRKKSLAVDSLLKLPDTLNESKLMADQLDNSEDIQMKLDPSSEPKELIIDQETIKF
uniref:NPHS1-3 n=1 Tax=Schmidtea mediterranea TaxID=79327 RepID=A0A0H3YJQ0_SCHMD|nr:NPHS1-3 [Schmidtea mediterranea]